MINSRYEYTPQAYFLGRMNFPQAWCHVVFGYYWNMIIRNLSAAVSVTEFCNGFDFAERDNLAVDSIYIGIDTKIEVIVVSPTTWEAHHSPRAKPEACGELPRSLVTPQWPKSGYQFLFYHDETKLMMNKQILTIQMLKFVQKLSLVTAWLHVHILGSCDLIVSPW